MLQGEIVREESEYIGPKDGRERSECDCLWPRYFYLSAIS